VQIPGNSWKEVNNPGKTWITLEKNLQKAGNSWNLLEKAAKNCNVSKL
jgi:hypothetical protein